MTRQTLRQGLLRSRLEVQPRWDRVLHTQNRCAPTRYLYAGGHTAEVFKVMDALDHARYQPRSFVAAATDRLAATKVQQHEQKWASSTEADAALSATLRVIPRSREVGQSWVTSAVTTAWAAVFSLRVLLLDRPHLVLANGPGTCLPLCLLAQALRMLGLLNCRVVFVESIARTRRLSMTGRILYTLRAADKLFVQWQPLAERFPRSLCAGRVY